VRGRSGLSLLVMLGACSHGAASSEVDGGPPGGDGAPPGVDGGPSAPDGARADHDGPVGNDAPRADHDGPVSGPDAPVQPPPPVGSRITTVVLSNDSGRALTGAFVTFAHPFRAQDVPAGATVAARSNGQGVALQVDAKATHADGSLRHAVLTASLPALAAGATIELELVSAPATAAGAPVAPAALLATAFDTTVSAALGGTSYTASARALLSRPAPRTWLSGPLVTEWTLVAPLAAGGTAHPHLTARFDVRAYAGARTAAVSVTVENDWAYEPGRQNLTYDAAIATDRGSVFSAAKLVHYTQARWRRTFVWGDDAPVGVRFDPAYLMSTGAVPNYDPQVRAAEPALAELASKLTAAATAPLGIGLAEPYMPETGGRGDIGLLPSWAALYLISQDPRARRATLATADGAGSWSIHYRDKATDRPVSLDDHPYMTLLGNPPDTCNPTTKVCDAFPPCAGDCASPYTPDSPHQPALAYLPYLLTGDRYYLDELELWANWNMLQANPGYRDHERGLVKWDQPRGQAWSMRTLGQVAFIAPDDDPLKKYFVDRLGFNLAWYAQQYLADAGASPLGYLKNGATLGDDGTLAPWMDDFFTSSIGQLVALGFADARPLRDWKAKFPIGRMLDPGYCWIFASAYHMSVQDPATKAFYPNFAAILGPTLAQGGQGAAQGLTCGSPAMAAALGLKTGEMVGYSSGPEGYPSNLQPALATAAESSAPGGAEAWAKFQARAVKPDYSSEPQFAIVPR
jgi:hypothetical protein